MKFINNIIPKFNTNSKYKLLRILFQLDIIDIGNIYIVNNIKTSAKPSVV